eukprot:3053158-Rhodomonas_salina.2
MHTSPARSKYFLPRVAPQRVGIPTRDFLASDPNPSRNSYPGTARLTRVPYPGTTIWLGRGPGSQHSVTQPVLCR